LECAGIASTNTLSRAASCLRLLHVSLIDRADPQTIIVRRSRQHTRTAFGLPTTSVRHLLRGSSASDRDRIGAGGDYSERPGDRTISPPEARLQPAKRHWLTVSLRGIAYARVPVGAPF